MKYRIADEPAPGGLEHLIVNPIWPLLASMLIGPWMGWAWFLFNATALGSPNLNSDRKLVLVGVAGSFALFFLMMLLPIDTGSRLARRLMWLVIDVWKLGVGYWLYESQSPSLEIHEYYGGTVRNGAPVLFAGFLLAGMFASLFGTIWWMRVALL